MTKITRRLSARNTCGLPLFDFARRVSRRRSLTIAQRHVARRGRIRAAATARLVAELAGYPEEDCHRG